MVIVPRSSSLSRWAIALSVVAGLALLLAPASATSNHASSTNAIELAADVLVSPSFIPSGISAFDPDIEPACTVGAETAGAVASTCHAYAKPVSGGCCATIENTECCGAWCPGGGGEDDPPILPGT